MVFLVALPLCIGIAVASGVPAELGIVTGVVGGLVVGLLPGSTMQVSGPAAGLTVLVAATVSEHGLAMLGVVVVGAGVLQIAMGATRLGTWFRAVPPSVVQGLLAGIGLVLILGQLYPAVGLDQPAGTWGKAEGIPGLLRAATSTAAGRSGLGVTVLTLLVVALWPHMPRRARAVPGPLVAVAVATGLTVVLGLPLPTIEVGSLLSSVTMPGMASFGGVAETAVLGSIVTFALIASAESLFTAAAVDRMHDGTKTDYNRELLAQGAGNTLCGLLGALPMTAVIVRSSTNLRAGARTKLSRVLHGAWMLLFVTLLPGVLSFIPTAVLAALLLHAGWKLLGVGQLVQVAREHRFEAFVVVLTAATIVGTDLLIGVLTGLGAAVLKTAWDVSRLSVDAEHWPAPGQEPGVRGRPRAGDGTDVEDGEAVGETARPHGGEHLRVRLRGTATFLRLPQLQDHLDGLPHTSSVHVDLTALRHLDRACHQAVGEWADRRRRRNCAVELVMPNPAE